MFEKEYSVHVYETSPDGRLALYSLFNYLQDIASDHAVRLGFGREDLMRQNRIWVLSRIYAVISQWPVWKDLLLVRTWHRGVDKLFALRDYEVFFSDGRPVAAATSSWVIIDQTSRRIQRPDSTLSPQDSGYRPTSALPRNALKLEPAAEEGRISSPYQVRLSDLDINLHTNNTKYLQWVMDSYEMDFTIKHVPCSAEINYLAESRLQDEIVIRTFTDGTNENLFSHSILRRTDGVELCRVRIEWQGSVEGGK